MSRGELLIRDVTALLKAGDDERKSLGEYGRSVIFQYYSVSKMADDCVRAYDDAYCETHGRRILMSGYYGFNNSGDEAILTTIYENICKMDKNIHITVLSRDPKETAQKYGFKDVVSRFDFFKVLYEIKKCDILLSGGGSLLQDTTSTRSLMYYLFIIEWAKIMRKKVMLYANGIGPVSRDHNRKMVKRVVSKADIITLREEDSKKELEAMGIPGDRLFVTADPVFTMSSVTEERAERLIFEAGIPSDKGLIGISVRNWKNDEDFIQKFADICDRIHDEFDKNIVFIVMHNPNDKDISECVMSMMKNKAYILDKNYSPKEIMGMIGKMDLILSMRLHTLIFATKQRVPIVGFAYDPKINSYLKLLGMPSGGNVSNIDVERTLDEIEEVLSNREKYVAGLNVKALMLEEKARLNEKYLEQLL